MTVPHRLALAAVAVAVSAATLLAQLPIPVQGGQPPATQPPAQGRGRGRGAEPVQTPDPPPVASAIAATTAEITGPGKFYETLMELKPGDDLAHFHYVTKEYFVSGKANGQPYKTRIVIRRPADDGKFSGFILAESMHPSGNPWMFHFTHTYSMTEGHIGLEILTSATQGFSQFNPERYFDGLMSLPAAATIISPFGTRRAYNGGAFDRYHAGTDFAGAPGTPVLAAAPGRVVLVEALNVRGNATIIDHGWGVYTGYWHQSQQYVQVGDFVNTGQVIGAIGSTGRVTGAHLHWMVEFNGNFVNPKLFT